MVHLGIMPYLYSTDRLFFLTSKNMHRAVLQSIQAIRYRIGRVVELRTMNGKYVTYVVVVKGKDPLPKPRSKDPRKVLHRSGYYVLYCSSSTIPSYMYKLQVLHRVVVVLYSSRNYKLQGPEAQCTVLLLHTGTSIHTWYNCFALLEYQVLVLLQWCGANGRTAMNTRLDVPTVSQLNATLSGWLLHH